MKEINIVNNLRVVGCEVITNVKSGHPGVVLSGAPIFYAIYKNLKVDSNNPKYINRDFFVNSAGHSSSLMYSTMNLFDYIISKKDLLEFRKINSNTPGHPEISMNGVDCSTGPLGQGVANSVGIALAQKHFAQIFNKDDIQIFNAKTYCFLGDGCMMEGVAQEAFSLAGTLKLNNLIYIYDRNRKTIEGDINATFNEDVENKFKAMGYNVITVKDGNNPQKIEEAILSAKNSTLPNLIIVDTIIGFGSHLEDNEKSHGKPFTKEEIKNLKDKLMVKNEFLEFNKEYKAFVKKFVDKRQKLIEKENKNLEKYKQKYPKDYEKLEKYLNFEYNIENIEKLNIENNLSPRENNSIILNEIAKNVENLIGGSADVNTSTMVYLKNEGYVNENFANRNIHFGVREHAMASICNGLAIFGGLIPFASCFLSFSNYLKPALRMSCLMNLPVLYEFSHDNITIGEDGPTHQPIEQIVDLRATPNLNVFRPYNITEILAGYKTFFESKKPMALILGKDKVTNQKCDIKKALRGGYVIYKEEKELKAVIISCGSEVELAINIAKKIKHIRVVSLPCFEIFDKQSEKYKKEILTDLPKISLDFSSSYSYYKYVKDGLYINMNTFGKSGSKEDILKEFGFTEEDIIKKIKKFLKNVNRN